MADTCVSPPTEQAAVHGSFARITAYRRIALLTEGSSTPFLAKTAMSMLRYREDDVIAVLDSTAAGNTTESLFGIGGAIPVVADLHGIEADALFIGIAPAGGFLPREWRRTILDALHHGIDVVSGLHDFLSLDDELQAAASAAGARIIDVRKNTERHTASGESLPDGCLRIHTVGQDCAVGKMSVSIEVQRGLLARGIDAGFAATGQTGIMISGDGIPIDCVVADFVNGSAEALTRRLSRHEALIIEGQGSLSHPSFSAVTLGLLHGCAPHGLIFCHEMGRTHVKGLAGVPLQPISRLIRAYEETAWLRHPCRVIGIGVNTRSATAEEAAAEIQRLESEFGLPVCDVYRDGADVLVEAVLRLKEERQQPR